MYSKGKRNSPKDRKASPSSSGSSLDLFNLRSPPENNTPTFSTFGYANANSRYVNIRGNSSRQNAQGSSPFNTGVAGSDKSSDPADPDTPKRKKEQNVFECMPTSSFEEVAFAAENGLGPLVPSATSSTLQQQQQEGSNNNSGTYKLNNRNDDDDDDFGLFSSGGLGSSSRNHGSSRSSAKGNVTKHRRDGQRECKFEFFGMDAAKLENFVRAKSIKPTCIQPGRTGNMIVCTYTFNSAESERKVQEVLRYKCMENGNIIGVRQITEANQEQKKSSIFAENNSLGFDRYGEVAAVAPDNGKFSWRGYELLSFIFAWLWDLIETFFGW